MFDLEQSVTNWREKFSKAGISCTALDELESHLREMTDALVATGQIEADAFQTAMRQLGSSVALKVEFNKLRATNCNLTLARCAWVVFVISFFLPAYDNDRGWQCAELSAAAGFWQNVVTRNWGELHLFLLTPANLVLVFTPFVLSKLARRPRAMNWLRGANLTALALVWSYIGLLLAQGGRSDLMIGCYVWAASFVLMAVSLFRRGSRKETFA